ncbi:hypothetical protein [Nocardia brasiliensis]|uniref:imine reductase family protein n=1 Tax=Nocardia brasiliensis TaxID=37326 RepID=UPI00366CE42D
MRDLLYAMRNGLLHTAMTSSADVSVETFAELAGSCVVVGPSLVELAPNLDKANSRGTYGTVEMNLNALDHITR